MAVVTTVGLWLEGRAEYESLSWFWTDHTAYPIQVAGMLSSPVAMIAPPLYELGQGGVSHAHLLTLLALVGALWAYMGWRFDNWGKRPSIKTPYRQIIGTVLALFGVAMLLNTVEMFHVGLVYRAIGIVWGLVILRHAFQFYRAPGRNVELN